MSDSTPPSAETRHTGEPGASPVELEIFLRVGGPWRHMYGLYLPDDALVEVMAGADKTVVVYEAEVGSIDEAVTTLATVARGEIG